MNNVMSKKLLSLLIIFFMLSVTTVFSAALDSEPQITDIYSPWAAFYIFMAQEAYELGDEGTFSNFRGKLVKEKFIPVYESVADAFNAEHRFESQNGFITRNQVVTAFYKLITGRATAETEEAINYFIETGLINGRNPGEYHTDDVCTVEEMLALAVRTYEHKARLTGNYSAGFLWEIQGENNIVYLLGSIHFGDGSIYPLSNAIIEAFAASENLVVEINALEPNPDGMRYAAEQGIIDPDSGKTIRDFISVETYMLYTEILGAIGLTAETYDYLMPWRAYLLLQGILLMESGESQMSALLGIDLYFLMKANFAGMNIIELESIESQIDTMASFSPELQEYLLLDSLMQLKQQFEAPDASNAESAQTAMDELLKMLEAFKEGNDALLEEMMNHESDEPLLDEMNDIMFIDRNRKMAETINNFLKEAAGSGNYFIIIGAGHLFGSDGLVEMLRNKGITVNRIR